MNKALAEEASMSAHLVAVRPLRDFHLEMEFSNGSRAIVNMENRIRSIRFARLASSDFFASAKAEGDRIVWSDGATSFSVYCNEILDTLLMD